MIKERVVREGVDCYKRIKVSGKQAHKYLIPWLDAYRKQSYESLYRIFRIVNLDAEKEISPRRIPGTTLEETDEYPIVKLPPPRHFVEIIPELEDAQGFILFLYESRSRFVGIPLIKKGMLEEKGKAALKFVEIIMSLYEGSFDKTDNEIRKQVGEFGIKLPQDKEVEATYTKIPQVPSPEEGLNTTKELGKIQDVAKELEKIEITKPETVSKKRVRTKKNSKVDKTIVPQPKLPSFDEIKQRPYEEIQKMINDYNPNPDNFFGRAGKIEYDTRILSIKDGEKRKEFDYYFCWFIECLRMSRESIRELYGKFRRGENLNF